jgi:hypothetical protein
MQRGTGKWWAVIWVSAMVLYACGGSSSQSNVIPLKTSTLRIIRPGDTWNFTVTGTSNDSVNTVNISGTSTTQVLTSTKPSPLTLANCLDEYTSTNLTASSGQSITSNTHSYYTQDDNGSIIIYGTNDGLGSDDIWVISPASGYFLSTLSPMAVGQTYGNSVEYSDGTMDDYTSSVVAIENVDSGMGIYEAYKIVTNATVNFTNGSKVVENYTDWYVPGLGLIKVTSDATRYAGGVLQVNQKITTTLSSTSVSYQPTPVSTGTVFGKVTAGGSGLSGVTVNMAGARYSSTITDQNGNYAFTNLPAGSYTLVPVKTGYTFSPAQISLDVNDTKVTGQDFTAT